MTLREIETILKQHIESERNTIAPPPTLQREVIRAIESAPARRRQSFSLSQLALTAAMLMMVLGAGAGAAWIHAHQRPTAVKVTPTANPTPFATPSGFPVPTGTNLPTKASPVPVASLPSARSTTRAQPVPSASPARTPTPSPSGFVPPGPVPDASAGSAVGYYAPGGYPILVNQQSPAGGGAAVFTTWKWDGTRWVKLFEGSSTPYVSGNMAYDPASAMTIGGGRGWNGSAWVNFPGPGVTGEPYLAFDAARNQLVLLDSGASGAVTWTFDGKSWKQASSTGPAGHYGAAFAYDPRNRAIVLVGGHSSVGFSAYADTWTWDGNAWTQQHPASSPLGGYGTMAFDDATQQMVLLEENGTTWAWSGASWSRLASAITPPFGPYAGMVYDSAHQDLFLWEGGGRYESGSQTWTYSNGIWARRS